MKAEGGSRFFSLRVCPIFADNKDVFEFILHNSSFILWEMA
jgi:hypothetical protein